jgi:hypothetical protein
VSDGGAEAGGKKEREVTRTNTSLAAEALTHGQQENCGAKVAACRSMKEEVKDQGKERKGKERKGKEVKDQEKEVKDQEKERKEITSRADVL